MSKCQGYIVTHKYGVQTYTEQNIPKNSRKGTLLNGGRPTVFKTRARAQGAIDRTIQYAHENGYENEAWLGPYHIKKLKFESELDKAE